MAATEIQASVLNNLAEVREMILAKYPTKPVKKEEGDQDAE